MGVFGHTFSVLVRAAASAGPVLSFHRVLMVTQVVACPQAAARPRRGFCP